ATYFAREFAPRVFDEGGRGVWRAGAGAFAGTGRLLRASGFAGDQSADAQSAASHGEGEVGDLAVHGRRAEPFGFVRSEAGVAAACGQTDAGVVRAADHGDGHGGEHDPG